MMQAILQEIFLAQVVEKDNHRQEAYLFTLIKKTKMKGKVYRRILGVVTTAIILIGASCTKDNNDNSQYDQIQPRGPKPSWGPTLTPQMQTVIETLDTIS